VSAHVELSVKPASKSARLLAGSSAQDFSWLFEHSRRFPTVAAMSSIENPELDTLAQRILKQIGGGQAATADASLALRREAGPGPGLHLNTDAYSNRGIEAQRCQNPENLVKAEILEAEAFVPADGTLGKLFRGPPEVTTEALSYRGLSLHRFSVEFDIERMARLNGTDEQSMRLQMGGDGQKYWFGTYEGFFVRVKAEDEEEARDLIDLFLERPEPLKSSKSIKEVRSRLPATTNFLQLIEASASAQSMVDGLAVSEGISPIPEVPEPLEGDEQYSGFALTIKPDGVMIDGWLALAAWQRYFDTILPALKTKANGLQFPR